MPSVIPLQPVPSQTLNVLLNNQDCTINVYQKFYGLFIDLYSGDELVIAGVIGWDRNWIVRSKYLGFDGDLSFIDTQGNQDHDYTSLGSEFLLFYFTPDEVAAQQDIAA